MAVNPEDKKKLDNLDLSESTKFKIDEENEEIWFETMEEGSTRGFQLKTVHQFISFVQTGVQVLKEHKKLTSDEDLSEEQQQLMADLSLFIHRYGTFAGWKEERKKLKTDYNDAVKDMRVLDKSLRASNAQNAELDARLTAAEEKIAELTAENEMLREIEGKSLELKKHNDELQTKVQELTKLTADLMKKLKQMKEDLAKFEDLKARNKYLEAEVKKFNTMLGFGDIDITEELRKKLISENTMKISARFLHKGWKTQAKMLDPENIKISEEIEEILESMKKPLNSMKVRMNLIEFFNKISEFIKTKTDRYVHLFNRTENKPLNNNELHEFVNLSANIENCIEFSQMLMNLLKSA